MKAGFMGRKSGKGFYVYEKGSKHREVNQEAVQILKERYSLEPKGANTVEDQQLRMVSRYVRFLSFRLCTSRSLLNASPVQNMW